jgi:hypothetical protein
MDLDKDYLLNNDLSPESYQHEILHMKYKASRRPPSIRGKESNTLNPRSVGAA